ncbi:MAG: NYN domain-containing protein, partial [Verrucomicrobiaceae bacterium]
MANQSPFGIHQDQKVTFLIEGANFYAAARNAGIKVDYKKLLAHFNDHSNFVRASYYTGVPDDTEYASIKPLLDFLEYNGYNLVTKPLKEHVDSMGRRKVKGNLDVEIAVDMMNAAKFADHIILFSGDSDFLPVVRDVQRQGVRVT